VCLCACVRVCGCSFLEKSRELKVDRVQATEFGNRLKQVEQRLNSLHTSVMQDAIVMPKRDETKTADLSVDVHGHTSPDRPQNVP